MRLIIIAALNRKGVIGRRGTIPWHIPEDLQRFKELTMGKTVLMGRKTFESIGKVLPGRRNIVVTSRDLPGIEHYNSIELALDVLRSEDAVWIIGGGEVFRQTIQRADEMFLTLVENDEKGETKFPLSDQEIEAQFVLTDEERHNSYSFLHYRKRQ
ncbi:MAG: dihydrofolate reductase [Bacteroidota bacterium]